MSWTYEIAINADEVHRIICECDLFQATAEAPAPVRNFQTTLRRVAEQCVYLTRKDGEIVSTFTITTDPPFPVERLSCFSPTNQPLYMSRHALSVKFLQAGDIIGLQSFRTAMQVAKNRGGSMLRAETNPRLSRVVTLMKMLGFEEKGFADYGSSCIYLQRTLSH